MLSHIATGNDLAKNQMFKKHVYLIHSYSELSLLGLKINDVFLKNASTNMFEISLHSIAKKELHYLINYKSRNDIHIKETLKSMIRNVIEFNILGDKTTLTQGKQGHGTKEKWAATSLLSEVILDGYYYKYAFSNILNNLLCHIYSPEIFGNIDLLVNRKFDSKFGFLTYQNCKRYSNLLSTPWVELAQYRKLMGLTSEKYTEFRDLKRRVINVGVEETNEHSDIIITPVFKKEGRQVVAIRHEIKKKRVILNNHNKLDFNDKLVKILKQDWNCTTNDICLILRDYDEPYVSEKINLIKNSESYKNNKIRYLNSYLLSALEKDYQTPKTGENLIKIQDIKQDNSEIIEKWKRHIGNCLAKDIGNIAITITNKFLHYIHHTSTFKDIYQNFGINNPLIKDELFKYISNNNPELLTKYIACKKYVEQNRTTDS